MNFENIKYNLLTWILFKDHVLLTPCNVLPCALFWLYWLSDLVLHFRNAWGPGRDTIKKNGPN